MPGYKGWSDGDNLTPADIDSYLMGQTLMRFPNAATRAGALPTPVNGMRSYLADTGLEYQFDTGFWVPVFQWIKKPATESVTNSTTFQDDDDLKVSLVPGKYRVEAFLHTYGDPAGDLKVQWAFTGTLDTANSSRACFGMAVAGTDPNASSMRATGHNVATSINYGTWSGVASAVIHEDMFLTVTAAGVFQCQWTQNAASTVASQVTLASRLYVTKLQ